jgi:hypothetical protein
MRGLRGSKDPRLLRQINISVAWMRRLRKDPERGLLSLTAELESAERICNSNHG